MRYPDPKDPNASWECPHCGRVYEELHLDPSPPWLGEGCVSDDCPGTGVDWRTDMGLDDVSAARDK